MRYCARCRAAFQSQRMCTRCRQEARADLSDPLLNSVLGDRYRILDRLAAGGMGQIYRAAHERIAALFAVKVLWGDLAADASMQSRFRREAEVASALQSRHIVRVVDFGDAQGLLYLVMELLDGASLSTRIAQAGRLEPRDAMRIAEQIARGLAHAHERGIVHRDLKSDNVMLVREDEDEEVVKLLDFGIARIRNAENQLTRAGQIMGTPQYMSPEQFSGAAVDARADLYALGIMMHEMMTGSLPFLAPDLMSFATAHLTQPPPRLRELEPSVPEALEAVVLKLLEKSPDDRYPSARAVLGALREISGNGPPPVAVTAPPVAAPRVSKSVPVVPVEAAAVEAQVADRIRQTIQLGAPTYNAGDHAGCYALYRDASEDLVRSSPAGAMTARLSVALARAARMTSTQAAWEMRYAFDDLLHASEVMVTSSDPVGRELAVGDAILAPRYAAGHLDIAGDYTIELARFAAETMRDPAVRKRLQAAVDQAVSSGGGQRALAGLAQALAAVRAGMGVATPAEMEPAADFSGYPGLAAVASELTAAIASGAPAYNAGDPDACNRIFRHAATEVVERANKDPRGAAVAARLRRALEDAAPLPAERAVWILRRAFDDLLAAASAN